MIKKTVAVLSLGILAVCVVALVGAQESSRRTSSAPKGTYERSALADRLRTARSIAPSAKPMPALDAQPIQPVPESELPLSSTPRLSSSATGSANRTTPQRMSPGLPTPAAPKSANPQLPLTPTPTPASPRPLPLAQPNPASGSSLPAQAQPADTPRPYDPLPTTSAGIPAPAAPQPLGAPSANTPAVGGRAPIALSPAQNSAPATANPTPAPSGPAALPVPPSQTAFRPRPSSAPSPSDTPRETPTPASPAPVNRGPAPANQGPAFNTAMLNRTENSLPTEQLQTTAQPLNHSELQRQDRALVQMTGPALQVTTEGPRAIVVGKRGSYVITVQNRGRVDAHEVKVRFQIPAGVRLDDLRATTGSAEDISQDEAFREYVWSVGKVAANGSEDIELQITPTENRPFSIETDWTLRSEAQLARIEVQQPILRLNITGTREMLFGTTKVFTVVISNPGTGPAENVVVDLSAGTAQAGSKKIGTLAAGEKREMELELTPRDVGNMEIHALASGDNGLQAEALHAVAVRRAELNVAVKGPAKKFAGSTGDYVVTITNTGDATAHNVIVDVNLPRGAEYVSGTESTGADGKLRVSAGDLTAGTAKTYEFRCLLNQPGDVQLTAAAQGDGDLSATAGATTNVEAIADLRLVVHDPRGPIPTGEEVVYELHITNRGTTAANDIRVIAQFSEGIEPTQAGGQAARLLEDGQVLFQPIRRLAQGESIILKVNATALQAGLHRFRAELTCKDPETRLVSEDSTKYFENN